MESGVFMKMVQITEIKKTLESFLKLFDEYKDEIISERPQRNRLDELRKELQIKEPQITRHILNILGNGSIVIRSYGSQATIPYADLLATALMGGNNELRHNFGDFHAPVTSTLTRAVGKIEAGLWPPKEAKPILIINDKELRDRCSDLLSAPNNYDRVIREATTILEDRIRNKCPHDVLSRLIPQSADQSGEILVNKMFSPDNPILSISNEKRNRAAFHKILIGVFSHLRNPYHHRLDPSVEWSWAWSTVGLIDRLLADVEGCSVIEKGI